MPEPKVEPRPFPDPIDDEGLERWTVQYQYRDGVVLDHILLSEFGKILSRIDRAEKERDEARKAHCEAQHDAEQTAYDERGTGLDSGPRTDREIAVEEYGQAEADRLFPKEAAK